MKKPRLSETLLTASKLQAGESRCSPEELAELSLEALRMEQALEMLRSFVESVSLNAESGLGRTQAALLLGVVENAMHGRSVK